MKDKQSTPERKRKDAEFSKARHVSVDEPDKLETTNGACGGGGGGESSSWLRRKDDRTEQLVEETDDVDDCSLVPALLDAIGQLKRQKSASDAKNIIGKVYRCPDHKFTKEEVRRALDLAVKRGLIFKLYMSTGSAKSSYFDPALLQRNKNRKLLLTKRSDMTKLLVRVVREWCGTSAESGTGRTLDEIYTFIQRTFCVDEKERDLDVRGMLKTAATKAVDQLDLVIDDGGRYFLGPNALEKAKEEDDDDASSVTANGCAAVDADKWELGSSGSSRSHSAQRTLNGKQRHSPAVALKKSPYKGNKSSPAKTPIKTCFECQRVKNTDGASESLLICKECGRCVHPSCVSYSHTLALRLLSGGEWRCTVCKPCAVCCKTAVVRGAAPFIRCDACDRGFHVDCLVGVTHNPVTASVSECDFCAKERMKKQKTVATKTAAANVRRRYKTSSARKLGRTVTRTRQQSHSERKGGHKSSSFHRHLARLGARTESAPELKGLTDSLTQYFTPVGQRRAAANAARMLGDSAESRLNAVKVRNDDADDDRSGDSDDDAESSIYTSEGDDKSEKRPPRSALLKLNKSSARFASPSKNPQLDILFDSLSQYFSPQCQEPRHRPPRGSYAEIVKGVTPLSIPHTLPSTSSVETRSLSPSKHSSSVVAPKSPSSTSKLTPSVGDTTPKSPSALPTTSTGSSPSKKKTVNTINAASSPVREPKTVVVASGASESLMTTPRKKKHREPPPSANKTHVAADDTNSGKTVAGAASVTTELKDREPPLVAGGSTPVSSKKSPAQRTKSDVKDTKSVAGQPVVVPSDKDAATVVEPSSPSRKKSPLKKRAKVVDKTEVEVKAGEESVVAFPKSPVSATRKRRASVRNLENASMVASSNKRRRTIAQLNDVDAKPASVLSESPSKTSSPNRATVAQSILKRSLKKQRGCKANADIAAEPPTDDMEQTPDLAKQTDTEIGADTPKRDTEPPTAVARPRTLSVASKRMSAKLLSKELLGVSAAPKGRSRKQSGTTIEKPPSVTDEDRELFAQANRQAEKNIAAALVDPERSRCPSMIQFGHYELQTWYSAPYPQEYARLPKLYICEFCLKYMKSGDLLISHTAKCSGRRPPATEVYRSGAVSVFEVDGNTSKSYCQNLCLLAKLFLDHKTLYYDVEPFLFYVVTANDAHGHHFVGYFSKEKYSAQRFNLSCIVTLPCYQKQGFGRFLIDFSFLLSRKEGLPGTPERPLSDLGKITYASYWRSAIFEYLYQEKVKNGVKMSIKRISTVTGIALHDITDTLLALQMLVRKDGRVVLEVNWKMVDAHWQKASADKCRIWIDETKLDWTPTIYSPFKSNDTRSPISSPGRNSIVSPTPTLRSPVAAAVVQDLVSSRSRKDGVKTSRRGLSAVKKRLNVSSSSPSAQRASPAAAQTPAAARKQVPTTAKDQPSSPPSTRAADATSATPKKRRLAAAKTNRKGRASETETPSTQLPTSPSSSDAEDDSDFRDPDDESPCKGGAMSGRRRRRSRHSSSSDSDTETAAVGRKRNRRPTTKRTSDAGNQSSTGTRKSERRSTTTGTKRNRKAPNDRRKSRGDSSCDGESSTESNKESAAEQDEIVKETAPLAIADALTVVGATVTTPENEPVVPPPSVPSPMPSSPSTPPAVAATAVPPVVDGDDAPPTLVVQEETEMAAVQEQRPAVAAVPEEGSAGSSSPAVNRLSLSVETERESGDEEALTTEAIELSELNHQQHDREEDEVPAVVEDDNRSNDADDESLKSSRCSSRASEDGPPTLQRVTATVEEQPPGLHAVARDTSLPSADQTSCSVEMPGVSTSISVCCDDEAFTTADDAACTPPQLSPILFGGQEEHEELTNGTEEDTADDDLDDVGGGRRDIQELELSLTADSLLLRHRVDGGTASTSSSLLSSVAQSVTTKGGDIKGGAASDQQKTTAAEKPPEKTHNPNPVINIVADSDTEPEWTNTDLEKPPRAPAMRPYAYGEEPDASQDASGPETVPTAPVLKSSYLANTVNQPILEQQSEIDKQILFPPEPTAVSHREPSVWIDEHAEPPPTVAALHNPYEESSTVAPPTLLGGGHPVTASAAAPCSVGVTDPRSNTSAVAVEYPCSNQTILSSPASVVPASVQQNRSYTETLDGAVSITNQQQPAQQSLPCLESPLSCHQQQRQSVDGGNSTMGFASVSCGGGRPPSITQQPISQVYCNGGSGDVSQHTPASISLTASVVPQKQPSPIQQQVLQQTNQQASTSIDYSNQQQQQQQQAISGTHHVRRSRGERSSSSKKSSALSGAGAQQQQTPHHAATAATAYGKTDKMPMSSVAAVQQQHQSAAYSSAVAAAAYQNGAFPHHALPYQVYDHASYQAAAMYGANPWSTYSAAAYASAKQQQPAASNGAAAFATPAHDVAAASSYPAYFNPAAAAASSPYHQHHRAVSASTPQSSGAATGHQSYFSAAAAAAAVQQQQRTWFSSNAFDQFNHQSTMASGAAFQNGTPTNAPPTAATPQPQAHFGADRFAGFYPQTPYFPPNSYFPFNMK